jgi:4-carboxymuconolactone decarboxylase
VADSSDFGTFARMSDDMKAAYEFTRELRGLVPGPHKTWLANPQLSKTIVPTGAYFQSESTLTKAETRSSPM